MEGINVKGVGAGVEFKVNKFHEGGVTLWVHSFNFFGVEEEAIGDDGGVDGEGGFVFIEYDKAALVGCL